MEKENVDGVKIQNILFLIFFGTMFVLVAFLFKPFFSILIWSSLVYGMTQPLYSRVTMRRDGKEHGRLVRSFMAAGFSIGSLILIVVPVTLLLVAMVGQLVDLFDVAMTLLKQGETLFRGDSFASVAADLSELSGGAIDIRTIDLQSQVSSFLTSYTERIIGLSAGLLRNLAGLVLMFAFFVFVLFFMYLDGKELALMFIDAIPLRNAYTVSFMRKFRDTGKDVVIGYILMAIFQGTMAFFVFFFMRVPAPLPLALLCAVASLIPLVGAGMIWVPVVLLRLASGPAGEALLLLVLCAVFISSLDNFIRPFLLHARIKLHPLLIFIAIIGGIDLFGVNGLILGPILLVLFFTGVDMFGKAYGKTRRRASAPEETNTASNLD